VVLAIFLPIPLYAAPDPNTCFGLSPTKDARGRILLGTDGDDILYGTPGDDVIYAKAGNDVVLAGGGNDVICGGAGHDKLWGGPGDDLIYGGSGNDQLGGSTGLDTLYGGDDWDELGGGPDTGSDNRYANDNDVLYGDLPIGMDHPSADIPTSFQIGVVFWTASENEVTCGNKLGGGDGDDLLYGGNYATHECPANPFNDRLYGDAGDDTIRGLAGDDYIEGNFGYDVIYGGIGNDMISGGMGNDRLFGGPGLDTLNGGLDIDSADCGADSVDDIVSISTERLIDCP
jgi:Ca2+-binding RTX toxin-like protein